MRRSDLQLIAEARTRAASGAARRLRVAAGLSQQNVASAVGVDQATVAGWESGRFLPKGKHAIAYGRLLRDLANWTA
jgi:DNA-binding XRE family transcriptional regulator